MKTASLLSLSLPLVVGAALAKPVQRGAPADQAVVGVYRPVEFGLHHRVMQKLAEVQGETTITGPNESENPIGNPSRYVELVARLNDFEDGQRGKSEERIDLHARGAAVLTGNIRPVQRERVLASVLADSWLGASDLGDPRENFVKNVVRTQ